MRDHHLPTLREYQAGDLQAVNCAEADPYPGWSELIEDGASQIQVVALAGLQLVVFGYVEVLPGVGEAFALVDRPACAGHGMEVAMLVREAVRGMMSAGKLHRAQATCAPHDRAAAVFLRAVGFRFECRLEAGAADSTDLLQFKLIRR